MSNALVRQSDISDSILQLWGVQTAGDRAASDTKPKHTPDACLSLRRYKTKLSVWLFHNLWCERNIRWLSPYVAREMQLSTKSAQTKPWQLEWGKYSFDCERFKKSHMFVFLPNYSFECCFNSHEYLKLCKSTLDHALKAWKQQQKHLHCLNKY